tara:strand:+ start:234 stop:530 length:297 start_codon:yes stop_codon:yes gene_type:complete
MNRVPVLTKSQLIDVNNWAIKTGYNRAVKAEPLKEYVDSLDDDTRFPISFHLPHHHKAGVEVEEHVRCNIVLGAEGNQAMIDIDLDFFNGLETIEVPE